MDKIVLAYSGGLDTSVIIHWLKSKRECEVIAFVADLGQGGEDLKSIAKRAKATGASAVKVSNLKKRFVEEYVWPALRANAVYENGYPLNTALGRPLIAAELVAIAKEHGAQYVAHGCTGKGNDQVRFEAAVAALAPELKIIAPVRVWEFKTREEEIDYAQANGIKVPVKKDKPYSIDLNLWGASIECGALENPWTEPPRDTHIMTRHVEDAPNKPVEVMVEFEEGIPVKLNGKRMDGVQLITELNKIAGEHAIGRVDMIENRVVGIKSREVYEAPGATVLLVAHKALEELTLSREVLRQKAALSQTYSDMIYGGKWFTDLRDALDGFMAATQKCVTGAVRLRLFKGACMATGKKSPYSLYKEELATYAEGDVYRHDAAEGFLELYNLEIKAQGARRKKQTRDK